MGRSTSSKRSGKADPPTSWTNSDADNAVKRIKAATAAIGVVLPSVDRQYFSFDFPLIELGRVRPDVADKLSGALEELLALRAEVKELRKAAVPHG